MALTDSQVFAWGSNACGQLGSRTFKDKGMPTEVRDLAGKHISQVACGDAHTLFLSRWAALEWLLREQRVCTHAHAHTHTHAHAHTHTRTHTIEK